MKNVPPDHQGYHRFLLRHEQEGMREIILNVRWKTLTLHPPTGKAKHYPDLQLTALIATEEYPENNNTRVEWKLLTDLPVTNIAGATEKLEWYNHRNLQFFRVGTLRLRDFCDPGTKSPVNDPDNVTAR